MTEVTERVRNGEDTSRAEAFVLDAGEPAVLLGTDTGPNPAESLVHALAACLTTSLVYAAAARGVRLTEVESTLEGGMDLRGTLGLSKDVRNGYEGIQSRAYRDVRAGAFMHPLGADRADEFIGRIALGAEAGLR